MVSVFAASPSPIVNDSAVRPSGAEHRECHRHVRVRDRGLADDRHLAAIPQRVAEVRERADADGHVVGGDDRDGHAAHRVNSSTTASTTASGARSSVATSASATAR